MADDRLMDVLTRKRSEPRGGTPEADDEPMLPDPAASYEPFSRPAARPVYALHFLLGREGCRSFQYIHLDSGSNFTADDAGQCIRLRFYGSKTFAVTIRGRNLWRLYDYIHQHRIAWVMQEERGRDFGADDESVVTSIEIEEIREGDRGPPG